MIFVYHMLDFGRVSRQYQWMIFANVISRVQPKKRWRWRVSIGLTTINSTSEILHGRSSLVPATMQNYISNKKNSGARTHRQKATFSQNKNKYWLGKFQKNNLTIVKKDPKYFGTVSLNVDGTWEQRAGSLFWSTFGASFASSLVTYNLHDCTGNLLICDIAFWFSIEHFCVI